MAKAKNTPPAPPAKPTPGEGPPHLRFPKLPADDPIFKAGFVIGIKRAADFATPSAPPQKPGPSEKE